MAFMTSLQRQVELTPSSPICWNVPAYKGTKSVSDVTTCVTGVDFPPSLLFLRHASPPRVNSSQFRCQTCFSERLPFVTPESVWVKNNDLLEKTTKTQRAIVKLVCFTKFRWLTGMCVLIQLKGGRYFNDSVDAATTEHRGHVKNKSSSSLPSSYLQECKKMFFVLGAVFFFESHVWQRKNINKTNKACQREGKLHKLGFFNFQQND